MKTTNTISALILTAVFFSTLTTACQNNLTVQNTAANQSPNKPTTDTNQNSNKVSNPEIKPTASDANNSSGSTPTAAYKAAYAARKNKDIKALKQLISKDMFEFLEIMGEGKENAIDEGLKQLVETPQGSSDDVRNEKINGNTATLEYLNKSGEWKTMDLVKEDGMWKLTIAKMGDGNSI